MSFNEGFMQIAMDEAKEGFNRGDLPVGACLIINGKLVGKSNNSNRTNQDWVSHAETSLLRTHAKEIQECKKKGGMIALYTTLEPCLMCLGTSFFNRVSEIFYACPDPNGGVAHLDIKTLPSGYVKQWPIISHDSTFKEESYNLLVAHMKQHESWKEVLLLFEKMRQSW